MPYSYAFAADTDIYVLDQTVTQIPPDILFVMDLSGSMRWTPAGAQLYIDRGNCTTLHGHTTCDHNCGDTDIPYYPISGGTHTYQCDMTNDINSGTENPNYNNMKIWGDSTCSGPFYTYNGTGTSASQTNCSRLGIAKRAIRNILDYDNDGDIDNDDYYNYVTKTGLNMRIGYMRFYACGSDTGNDYTSGCNKKINNIDTSYAPIWTSVNNANAYGGTHLAYSLKEAKLYLDDHKNGNQAKGMSADPAKACRKKFVILITDGEDTLACDGSGSETQSDQYKRRRESIAYAKSLADAGYKVFVVGFGANMPANLANTLNWMAYYGGTNNSYVSDSTTGTYNITLGNLYPSGISSCSSNKTNPGAQSISGYAYIAQSAQDLEAALTDVKKYIFDLLAKNTSYVAPVVPISQMESTNSEDRMYLAMFRPNLTSMWNGNIKKFGIANVATGNITIGDILDKNNQLAISPQNEFLTTATSYWSTAPDGGEVEKGGLGQVLLDRTTARNIYTYTGGTEKLLTASDNLFVSTNDKVTCAMLGMVTDCTTGKHNVTDFANGLDPYNWGHTANGKRNWILGGFIHSRPLVIHYAGKSVIFVGANDGMLHAFNADDDSGEELWAFIPPSLLSRLQYFGTDNTLKIFVDGTPKAYIEKDTSGTITKAIILFGLRRGGDRYIALNVTDPDFPEFLWEIASPSSTATLLGHEIKTGFERLEQTWSIPVIKKVANGTGESVVAFFAGGYDTCNDPTIPDPNGTCGSSEQKGNAIYAVNITTGALLWSVSKTQKSNMTYSIPSDIGAIDTNGDDRIDRLYVGDLGGQLWRFDIGNLNDTAGWTNSGKIIFKSNDPPSSVGRKIFYPPDVTESSSSNFWWVYFGTGDREKPKQETGTTTYQNRLYALKDSNPTSPFTESNLVDLTDNILQNPNPTNDPDIEALKVSTLNNLKTSYGWFITLERTGEKCLAPPVVYSGVVYYTTYTPFETPVGGDPCVLGEEGTGRLYALQYTTGMAAFNFDLENDVEGQPPTFSKTDQSIEIGSGMPSKAVFSIINNNVTIHAGIGDGVAKLPAKDRRNLLPLYWRMVF